MIPTHGPGSGHDADCFGCKLRSLQFGSEPTKASLTEKQWQRDMDAYAAMRAQRLQPMQIDGCAELQARATDKWEVERNLILDKRLHKEHLLAIKDAETILAENPTPATTVKEWRDNA